GSCCASRTKMLNNLRENVRRAASVLVACFAVIGLALGYWQVLRSGDLSQDPANPRVATARIAEPRGRILDRNGAVLAESEPTPNGYERHLAEASLVHTVGFHSDRLGDTD